MALKGFKQKAKIILCEVVHVCLIQELPYTGNIYSNETTSDTRK